MYDWIGWKQKKKMSNPLEEEKIQMIQKNKNTQWVTIYSLKNRELFSLMLFHQIPPCLNLPYACEKLHKNKTHFPNAKEIQMLHLPWKIQKNVFFPNHNILIDIKVHHNICEHIYKRTSIEKVTFHLLNNPPYFVMMLLNKYYLQER